MTLQADYFTRKFRFNFKARTSRGLMNDKTSWFIRISNADHPERKGIGEAGPLQGLSVDAVPGFDDVVKDIVNRLNGNRFESQEEVCSIVPEKFPALRFAVETAFMDLQNGGTRKLFNNGFIAGQPLHINGLIWMGDMDFMMNQINEKIASGFRCIKLKVGGLDFDRECDTLNYIRKRYYRENIIIRLDANGAFKLDEVLYKLEELSKYDVHSIEQPIKPGLPEMKQLCRKTPIPIALDEELIGKFTHAEKEHLLEDLKPQYIILKPTLLGGFDQCADWISLAEKKQIGWWMTSALESNIGLNAIAQFTANYNTELFQGLGTGAIYSNNFSSPLSVQGGKLFYDVREGWSDPDLQ
jgi:o-succinylbenzoate synthase